ncbi:CDP-diacylglycerol--serine O-phosphatidyltransferase [Fangia hongkongensis]|uniref:CDP-diacylglycerol--serine O-phosphatidyltransferase n=1 Tax=Fangia hongkongensis TaxID=270495 RepID=UPI000372666A|nr:CDP-diacylglycerol--serine O-phosphatidyltransferase [Fangia hongkongensis]MBK2123679.1 CDP-diacylglycerol--serine O-phosphatidyltransferase [Fangia hongkongensis]
MKNNHQDPRGRGIYILPNLFTSASLFAGFFAIISAFNSHFVVAAICIYLAAIMDSLDGRVARLTHTESAFGAEYDSLADIVSFGVAPALIIYFWAVKYIDQFGWAIAFVYLACVALRLARFNTQLDDDSSVSKRYFTGLPCPAAAATIAGFVWLCNRSGYQVAEGWLIFFAAIITLYLSAMMVSNIKFRSFKDYDLKGKVVFTQAVIVVFIIAIIFIDPSITLFIIFMLYALSGSFAALFFKRRQKAQLEAMAKKDEALRQAE